MHFVGALCAQVIVLNFGRKIAEGTPEHVREDRAGPRGLSRHRRCGGSVMRLEVNDLHVRYGRVHAVRGVSLTVEEGEVVAVLGANGAGKSSLLKALMGLEPAAEGSVTLDGADITRWPTSRRVRQHLALVPEGRRIVTSLTVHENLLMGAFARKDVRCGRRRNRRNLFALSEPRGAAGCVCFGAVGRRAADAGDRAGAFVRAEADDAGRAVAGLEPAADQRGVRADRRAEPLARPCDPAWSSRILTRRWNSPIEPMCWSSAARSWRGCRPNLRDDPSLRDAYLGRAEAAQTSCRINLSNHREE